MPSVTIVFRKDKLNKNNEGAIHFRIVKDRKSTNLASGYLVNINDWDFIKHRVKAKHPNSARLNSYLSNKFTELQDQVLEHETNTKSNTTKKLKEKVFGKKPVDFFPFAETTNNEFSKAGKIGTFDKNKAIIEKLKKYVNKSPITFQDIDFIFLTKYESYLRNNLHNKTNTCINSFKFISHLFRKAYNHSLIEHELNPFNKFKIKEEKTERVYLSEDEVIILENYQPTSCTKIEIHKDMFVFACYAGGIRISDMLQLKWKLFDGENLNITMQKTKGQISIKVPNVALAILDKYRPEKVIPNNYIFPLLSQELNINKPRELDTAISRASALVNKNLIEIGKKAGIEKHLSFHVSRHTWATRALTKGMSIDKVSKILGHASIRETQIYAKIINVELNKAMDLFNN